MRKLFLSSMVFLGTSLMTLSAEARDQMTVKLPCGKTVQVSMNTPSKRDSLQVANAAKTTNGVGVEANKSGTNTLKSKPKPVEVYSQDG